MLQVSCLPSDNREELRNDMSITAHMLDRSYPNRGV